MILKLLFSQNQRILRKKIGLFVKIFRIHANNNKGSDSPAIYHVANIFVFFPFFRFKYYNLIFDNVKDCLRLNDI